MSKKLLQLLLVVSRSAVMPFRMIQCTWERFSQWKDGHYIREITSLSDNNARLKTCLANYKVENKNLKQGNASFQSAISELRAQKDFLELEAYCESDYETIIAKIVNDELPTTVSRIDLIAALRHANISRRRNLFYSARLESHIKCLQEVNRYNKENNSRLEVKASQQDQRLAQMKIDSEILSNGHHDFHAA